MTSRELELRVAVDALANRLEQVTKDHGFLSTEITLELNAPTIAYARQELRAAGVGTCASPR